MSVIAKLEEAGLLEELTGIVKKFAKDADTPDSILAVVDESGLKGTDTMAAIGTAQREGRLRPGLYKELVNLNKRLKEPRTGGNDVGKKDEVKSEEVEVAEVVEDAADAQNSEDEVEVAQSFTDKEEQKIREAMKKEEDKMRKRLAAREQKIRERMKNRLEKRAQRQGMKLEEAQGIAERREKIKEYREQIKDLREKMKALQAEIKELRPTRPRKKKADAGEVQEAQTEAAAS